MGRRGRSGGRGRSSGGRSRGGFSGGGRSSRGGFGGAGRRGSSNRGRRGNLGGGNRSRPTNRRPGYNRPARRRRHRGYHRRGGYYGGWGWGPRYRRGGRYYGGGGCFNNGCGCFSLIFVLVIVLGVFNFAWPSFSGSGDSTVYESTQVTPSTREREPLESGLVNETEYFTDEIGEIQNHTTLENGLRHFYNETGIQPYVYLTEDLNGETNPSEEELIAYSENLYDELFTDEAHLLFFYFESDDLDVPGQVEDYGWYTNLVLGHQVGTVMDNEAIDIFYDYFDNNYYNQSNTYEEVFALTFQQTADRIMEVTSSPWIPVLVIVGLIILAAILFSWWRSVTNKDQEEKDKQDEENKFDNDDDGVVDF